MAAAVNSGAEFAVWLIDGDVDVRVGHCRCGGSAWTVTTGVARSSLAVFSCGRCGARKSLETAEDVRDLRLGDGPVVVEAESGLRLSFRRFLSERGLNETPTLVDLPSPRLTVTSAPSTLHPAAAQSQAQVSFDLGCCSCGSGWWTLVQPGIGEVVRAECPSGCGEKRVVRLESAVAALGNGEPLVVYQEKVKPEPRKPEPIVNDHDGELARDSLCAHCRNPIQSGTAFYHSTRTPQRCCSHDCVRDLARAQRAERHEHRKAASAERFAAVVGTLRSLESEELASLAEGRPMLFQTIRVWAGIKRHGEAGERIVPHAARAILTERAEHRAREHRAAIRDEWDNLPDAEPVFTGRAR